MESRVKRPENRRLLRIVLLLTLVFSTGTAIKAGNFVITTTSSTGPGSLHEAMEASELNGEADVITFAVSGTIVLPSGLPFPSFYLVNEDLTIDGFGQSVIISCGGTRRFLYSGADVSIRNLIIERSFNDAPIVIFDGAVTNAGNMSISNVEFRDNYLVDTQFQSGFGAAVSNGGTIEIESSKFSGNIAGGGGAAVYNSRDSTALIRNSRFEVNASGFGGAIYNRGFMRISESVFRTNSATHGGAIYVDIFNGPNQDNLLEVSNSTFSGNTADAGPAVGNGGGIYLQDANAVVVNSTFAGNRAMGFGGAISNDNSSLNLINSTIAYNGALAGGGIRTELSSTTLRNTIVADNNGDGQCSNFDSGTVLADARNLDTDGTCGDANQVTSAQLALGTLLDNGGPTSTIALLPGSVGIDSGDNLQALDPDGVPLATDQRGAGYARVSNGTVDVGAFEVQASAPVSIGTLISFVLTLEDTGEISESHGRAINNKLHSASNQIEKGNLDAAINKLNEVIIQTGELIADSQISATNGNQIIAQTQTIVQSLE